MGLEDHPPGNPAERGDGRPHAVLGPHVAHTPERLGGCFRHAGDDEAHREQPSFRLRHPSWENHDRHPLPGWRLKAGYSRETKKGAEETYADFLYRTTGLPKPIDYRTEEFSAGLGFDRGPFLAAAEFRNSQFRNEDRFLEWENPWAGRTVEYGRKALAPGNDARSVSFVSRLDVGHGTTINAALT